MTKATEDDAIESCPNCEQPLENQSVVELTNCPQCGHELAIAAEIVQVNVVEDVDYQEQEKLKRNRVEKMLPPKFLVEDPDFQGLDRGENVFLPDGKGGITSVKRNVVKVQHKGKTVELVALSPEKRRRQQLIWNCVWIFLGVFVLLLALSMI